MSNIDKIICVKLCSCVVYMVTQSKRRCWCCVYWLCCTAVQRQGSSHQTAHSVIVFKITSNSFTFGHGNVYVAGSTSRCCRFWSLWFLSMTCASISTVRLCHQILCLWYLLYNVLEGFLIKYNRPMVIEIFSVTGVCVVTVCFSGYGFA